MLCVLIQILSRDSAEKKTNKGVRVSNFALLLVVFKWHHGSEGVNLHKFIITLQLFNSFQFFVIPCRKFGPPYMRVRLNSSATHSCQRVQRLHASKQWYVYWYWGFLMCAQMMTHATVHRGCTNTVMQSARKAESGRKILHHHWGTESASLLNPAFPSDALAAGLSCSIVCLWACLTSSSEPVCNSWHVSMSVSVPRLLFRTSMQL